MPDEKDLSPEGSSAPGSYPGPRPNRGAARPGPGQWTTGLLCAALLVLFGLLAYFAVLSKSPTYDEPLHTLAAYLQTREGDFRLDPEDPPLWKYWAAIPNAPRSERFPTHTREFREVADDIYHEWPWTVEALYPCGRSMPLNSPNCPDTDAFIMRSRVMMVLIGVVLGGVIAWWGWQLAGGAAALIACALFCLSPNFLAHSALVKNDVPLTLCAVGLFLAIWRAGRRLTIWNALAICLLCAAAVTTKFSGLILGPIVALLLLIRAVVPAPWPSFLRTFERFGQKLLVAIMLIIAAGCISYLGIWATYQFRFEPTPNRSIRLDLKRMAVYTAMTEQTVRLGHAPDPSEIGNWKPGWLTRMVFILDDGRVLPEAWLTGFLYTYQSALYRATFLMGQYSTTGWWYYFPLAMLFKTPLATLAAALLAIVVLVRFIARKGWGGMMTWSAACLLLPPVIFLGAAMRSNLNLGLRHILPVYPFIYLGIALAGTYALRHWRKPAIALIWAMVLGLASETLLAFPDFIPFFNAAAGGERGGLALLGDSNLDWGQDLKLLAQWQRAHPNVRLYLVYFGVADPWSYGIRYINLPNGYAFGPQYETRTDPGVVAISATNLQGIYNGQTLRRVYGALRNEKPIAVLGGSIYLYRWPPRQLPPPTTRQAPNLAPGS
jgi:4-amino-4-deoxy-L-arabinose transferase-like glycosyltransferase